MRRGADLPFLGRGQHKARTLLPLRRKGGPVGPDAQPHVGPVIQPCALEVAVFKLEAQRLNEVQGGIRGGAQPGDIACIWGNFRLKKNYLHGVADWW